MIAVIGSLLGDSATWIERALVVLVAASPCALAISVPVTAVASIGAASRRGILIKGGAAMEALGRVRTVALDKTGTLTRNRPAVVDVATAPVSDRDQVLGWAAAVAVSVLWLPPLPETDSDLKGFASESNPAVQVEQRSFEFFGFPLSSRTSIVQRDPDGLSPYAQAEAVLRAAALSRGEYDTDLVGALPIPNTFAAFPGSRERGTTVLTYVFGDPGTSFGAQRRAAQAFAREQLTDPLRARLRIGIGTAPERRPPEPAPRRPQVVSGCPRPPWTPGPPGRTRTGI